LYNIEKSLILKEIKMYIIPLTERAGFLAGMAPKFRGYTSTFPYRSIRCFNDILFAATNLYAYGTPFANPMAGSQPHYLTADIPHLEIILTPFVEKVWKYFNDEPNTPNTQANFDAFQEELCDDFGRIIANDGRYVHTYGNCQKMVNMLFKYLTCFSDYDEFADLFSYCHIPIDRNILESFRNNYGVANITSNMKYRYTNVTTGSVEEEPWSRISKDAYKSLLAAYRAALVSVKGNNSWLGLEYYIWRGASIPTTGTHAIPIKNFQR
jgi:hypothetical protein